MWFNMKAGSLGQTEGDCWHQARRKFPCYADRGSGYLFEAHEPPSKVLRPPNKVALS